jgi:Ser/Thr protein kinase RdoA (MazF antagonist)
MSAAAGRPPLLSSTAVCSLVSRYFNVRNIAEDSVKSLPGYDDVNYYLCGEHLDSEYTEFVLKLGNPVYTPFPVMVGLNKLMNHISSRGFKFATPRPLFSSEGTDILSLTAKQLTSAGAVCDKEPPKSNGGMACNSKGGMEYLVRLLPYIPGKVFDDVEKEYLIPEVLNEVGAVLATIDKEFTVIA